MDKDDELTAIMNEEAANDAVRKGAIQGQMQDASNTYTYGLNDQSKPTAYTGPSNIPQNQVEAEEIKQKNKNKNLDDGSLSLQEQEAASNQEIKQAKKRRKLAEAAKLGIAYLVNPGLAVAVGVKDLKDSKDPEKQAEFQKQLNKYTDVDMTKNERKEGEQIVQDEIEAEKNDKIKDIQENGVAAENERTRPKITTEQDALSEKIKNTPVQGGGSNPDSSSSSDSGSGSGSGSGGDSDPTTDLQKLGKEGKAATEELMDMFNQYQNDEYIGTPGDLIRKWWNDSEHPKSSKAKAISYVFGNLLTGAAQGWNKQQIDTDSARRLKNWQENKNAVLKNREEALGKRIDTWLANEDNRAQLLKNLNQAISVGKDLTAEDMEALQKYGFGTEGLNLSGLLSYMIMAKTGLLDYATGEKTLDDTLNGNSVLPNNYGMGGHTGLVDGANFAMEQAAQKKAQKENKETE